MQSDKRWKCLVCEDFLSDSRIDVQKHIMDNHEFRERLDALMDKVIAEDEYGKQR